MEPIICYRQIMKLQTMNRIYNTKTTSLVDLVSAAFTQCMWRYVALKMVCQPPANIEKKKKNISVVVFMR